VEYYWRENLSTSINTCPSATTPVTELTCTGPRIQPKPKRRETGD